MPQALCFPQTRENASGCAVPDAFLVEKKDVDEKEK